MIGVQQLWAIEWNPKQKMPHIEPLIEFILDSIGKMLDAVEQEWFLVGVEKSHDEASKYATVFEIRMKKEGRA